MKVLHITFTDSGGAGIAAVRIHNSLKKKDVESKMLVALKTSNDDTIIEAQRGSLNRYIPPRNKLLRKYKDIMRGRGYYLTPIEKYDRSIKRVPQNKCTTFSSPITNFELSHHPAVIEADIIHLHWIANFVDYNTFFPNIEKPIVWTLHDENLAFGGFHYRRDKELYYEYYAEAEDAYCQIKKDSLSKNDNIHVVALSKMMKSFYSKDSFLSNRNISIIHNGIEESTFYPIDKQIGRKVLNIPYDNKVIVFCCVDLTDKRKGLDDLILAIKQLNLKKTTLLCIGTGHADKYSDFDIRYTGPILNKQILSMLYSCGDLFAFPSYQEAFAQTPLEAISCGLPIVAYPCSGMEELVNDKNGVVCDDFSIDCLSSGLLEVLNKKIDSDTLHNDIAQRFNIDLIAKQYIDLYDCLLKKSHNEKDRKCLY